MNEKYYKEINKVKKDKRYYKGLKGLLGAMMRDKDGNILFLRKDVILLDGEGKEESKNG